MKTLSPPHQAVSLAPKLYFQLVHTLTDLLPPPLDDTPEGLRARNLAAIAKAAAMSPVNADETDLAAQCVAARGQAEDLLRLLRENRHDIALTMRLNAQYTSMMRASASARTCLLRVQAARQKREAIEGAAEQDERRRQAVEQCMLIVVDADSARMTASPRAAREESPRAAREESPRPVRAEPPRSAREEALQAARGEATRSATAKASRAAPKAAPVTAPTPHGHQTSEQSVSEKDKNSQDVTFETWMREQPWNQGPDETGLAKHLREVMTELHLAGRELSANGPDSPSRTGESIRPAE